MKHYLLLILIAVLVGCNKADYNMDADENRAPDFTLTDLENKQFTLSDHRGKVVVMYFFLSSNCLSCLANMPDLEEQILKPYANNADFVFVGLDAEDGTRESVQFFKNFTHASFPLLLNASGVAGQYLVPADRLIVVDQEGMIKYRGTMPVAKSMESCGLVVNNLLKN